MSVQRAATVFDIFLSHAPQDAGLAHFVVDELTEGGLSVFAMDDVGAGEAVLPTIREEMGGASAVVILVTRSAIESHRVPYEVGLASGLSKPIYIVYDGVLPHELPRSVENLPCFPVSKLPDVISAVQRSQANFTEAEREKLVELYLEQDRSVDELTLAPPALRLLADRFGAATDRKLSGEQVVRELIRMRKKGQLPRQVRNTEV